MPFQFLSPSCRGTPARFGSRSPTARKEVLVMGRARGYKRSDKAGEGIGYDLNYYAHTAVRSDGSPELETAKWQLLSTHLRNVARLAERLTAAHLPAHSSAL